MSDATPDKLRVCTDKGNATALGHLSKVCKTMKGRLKQELHKQLLKTEGFALAEDKLILPAVSPQFFGHAGLPAATDSLAYEPVQRILAVSLSLNSSCCLHRVCFHNICVPIGFYF